MNDSLIEKIIDSSQWANLHSNEDVEDLKNQIRIALKIQSRVDNNEIWYKIIGKMKPNTELGDFIRLAKIIIRDEK